MHLPSKASVPVFVWRRSWCPAHWVLSRAALSCSARCSDCQRRQRWPFLYQNEFVNWPWVFRGCLFGIGSRDTIFYAVASRRRADQNTPIRSKLASSLGSTGGGVGQVTDMSVIPAVGRGLKH